MIQSWCKLIFSLFIGTFFVAINSFALPSLEGIQVYQKNIHLSEERKQSLADDIDRYRNADNMWDVLRAEFTLPHYEDNPLVQEQINWFLNNQEFLQRAASRAAPYLYYISQQVRKRHLPAEVVLLPMIESAYNPFVYSSAGAGGIWQMMPDTATGYGVKQNWWYDGRRDIVASTKAALDYLVYLGGFFDGNWLLAIAAYNTGEGNVLAAIRRNVRDNRNTDFWSLPVHQQTREYVPRLLALASIIAHSDKYSLTFPGVNNAPYLAQIDMGGQIDLSYAAKLAGLSLRDLKQLNPGYNRATTDPSGPFKIVLPIENVAQFSENLLRTPSDERVHWNHYKVRNGDTLVAIARKFKTTADTLSKMNSLKTAQLKPGVQLIVPQSIPDISQTILDSEKRLVTARNTKPPVKSVQAIKTAL
ncbi:MAG TPA: transglycosylase SLT domain-containing protein, partial [Gammaproteobacteria bacterium]|nr:transglycosylase SLT domain-containing protein [Gammaproteobacteria bacterium]